MNEKIRELRDKVGLTQKAFAERYGIPLSTLRKWEQGEASPAPYVVRLIASDLSAEMKDKIEITGSHGNRYFISGDGKTVSDPAGNVIRVKESFEGVKKQNLPVYLDDLFEAFYRIQRKFDQDLRYDKEEDIIWTGRG